MKLYDHEILESIRIKERTDWETADLYTTLRRVREGWATSQSRVQRALPGDQRIVKTAVPDLRSEADVLAIDSGEAPNARKNRSVSAHVLKRTYGTVGFWTGIVDNSLG